jgi:predicted hydrocarbon binding protein
MFIFHFVYLSRIIHSVDSSMLKAGEPSKSEKLNDFYRLDYRTGAVFNQITEERVQLIPVQTWRMLKNLLAHGFQKDGPTIMSHVGAALGSSFAEEIMKEISDPEILARRLPDVAAASGWGVISMMGDMRYGSKFEVSVANCIFCDVDVETSPQCDLLVGTIEGAAEVVFGTPHNAWEARCSAMGDSVCLVEVEESLGEQRPMTPGSVDVLGGLRSGNQIEVGGSAVSGVPSGSVAYPPPEKRRVQ